MENPNIQDDLKDVVQKAEQQYQKGQVQGGQTPPVPPAGRGAMGTPPGGPSAPSGMPPAPQVPPAPRVPPAPQVLGQNAWTNNPQTGPWVNGYGMQLPMPPEAGKSCGIISLILSIIAIVFCWMPLLGLGLGIAGLVLSLVSKKQAGRFHGLAIAGLICSICALVFHILLFLLVAIVAVSESFYYYW